MFALYDLTICYAFVFHDKDRDIETSNELLVAARRFLLEQLEPHLANLEPYLKVNLFGNQLLFDFFCQRGCEKILL